ncbi:hypothetical protein TRVA0_028S00276 [Trichomonascus vanleenenianus]|uniref:telomerase reverse transcriptase n=1 Tax=Trichomonascus vanleenenianus TaxID=2268995 RepID=UPI003ECA1EE4
MDGKDPLKKLFPENQLLTLAEYLSITVLDQEIRELLEKTLVVKSSKKLPLDVGDVQNQHQLVVRCVYHLILHDYGSNVLCDGYKIQRERLIVIGGNTAIPVLVSPPWVKLFSIIGAQKMLQLLLGCNVFYPLDYKLSYLQLCGPSLDSGQLKAKPIRKQLSINNSLHALKVCAIFKHQVLNRCPYVDTAGQVVFRFKPNFHLETIAGKNNVWKVMSVMFPLELGEMMPVYIGPKQQIVLSGEKRPSLGYSIEPIVARLLTRHSSLPYGHLLKSICRSVASVSEVARLCKTVVKRLIPFEMFATQDNWNAIFESIEEFVALGAADQYKLANVFEKIKLSTVKWLWPSKPGTEEEFLRRQRIMLQLLFWLFKKLLIKLIQVCFHVAPSPLCYYRQDCWLDRSQQSIDAYLNITMRRVAPGHVPLLSRSRLRAVPKPNRETCRIIMDMRSANKQLDMVYQILSFEVRDNSWIKNPSDLASVLEEYKCSHSTDGRYYLIKFDIQNAFDTIPAELAYRLSSMVIRSEQYYIHELKCRDTRTGRACICKVVSTTNEAIGSFSIKNKVVGSIATTRVVTRHQVLDSLKEHLFSTEVILPKNRAYRKVKGIPQGSILSTILCNIVYDELEKSIQVGANGILLRYVDDFLYISSETQDCHSMLHDRLPNGSVAGAKALTAKTVTNLVENQDFIPFIGCQISTQDLGVYTIPPALNISNKPNTHQLAKIRSTVQMAISRSTSYEDALNCVLMIMDQVPREKHSFVMRQAKQAIERKYIEHA